MLLGIDQLIITVDDWEAAAADFTKLGFRVVERPDVAKPATVSRFIPFADGGYIMLQHVRPEAAAKHRLASVLSLGDGWADYALRTDDLPGDKARAVAADVHCAGPHSAVQPRSDGKSWAVDLLMFGRAAGENASPALPFLAEDRAERSLRVPGLEGGVHPNGAATIEGVTIVARDAPAAERRLATIIGAASREMPADLAGASRRWRFPVGRQWLDLVEADQSSSPLSQHLGRRGDGVYEVALRTATPGAARLLDVGLAHGARLKLI